MSGRALPWNDPLNGPGRALFDADLDTPVDELQQLLNRKHLSNYWYLSDAAFKMQLRESREHKLGKQRRVENATGSGLEREVQSLGLSHLTCVFYVRRNKPNPSASDSFAPRIGAVENSTKRGTYDE